jgi:hypothetical protein
MYREVGWAKDLLASLYLSLQNLLFIMNVR